MPLDRREFLALAALLGVGGAATACGLVGGEDAPEGRLGPDATVLIIGAGAAGMAAGHLLAQRGVTFTILEAAPTYGGRIKHTRDFVDFPIPLGGEWLHVAEDTLATIVNDESVAVTTRLQGYDPTHLGDWVTGGSRVRGPIGDETDLKFVGSSWLDFFETFVLPSVADHITYDAPVVQVDHDADGVRATDTSGTVHVADAAIVTVPMKILQDGDIGFDPPLPDSHQDALDRANIWTGMKVFVEFTEAFYGTYLAFEDDDGFDGQRLYYDAAYGQDSDANVLGLFTVGVLAEPYQALDPGDELRDHVLAELDALYDGAATRTYVQHTSQNWADEPYIRAAYLADEAPSSISRTLAEPIGPRVHLAGCSYTRFDDWSSVHTAARSARDTVDRLLG